MNLGRLSARVIIGGLLIGHGTQKLKGWFVGPGVEDTAGTMESLEPNPAPPQRGRRGEPPRRWAGPCSPPGSRGRSPARR